MKYTDYEYWKLMKEVEQEIRNLIQSIKEDCPKNLLADLRKESSGIFYRFEIERSDRYTYFISNKERFKKAKDNKYRCMMCGLSVYLSYENSKEALGRVLSARSIKFPNLKKQGYKILICENLKDYGELYNTPTIGSKHYTFFPCSNYNPNNVWKIYEESV